MISKDSDSDLQIIVGNYNYSSWSMRGWLAVMHSKLPHDTVRHAMFTEEGTGAIRAISPTGLVPCLVDRRAGRDIKVWDSLAIIDYLARETPSQYWWPEDPAAYAFARAISAEMHSGFMALRQACPMNLTARYENLHLSAPLAADIARVEEVWREARSRFGLTNEARPGPFLFGAWSAADIMYAPVVTRLLTYGIKVSNVAKAYIANVDSHMDVDSWRKAAQFETERLSKYDYAVKDGMLGRDL